MSNKDKGCAMRAKTVGLVAFAVLTILHPPQGSAPNAVAAAAYPTDETPAAARRPRTSTTRYTGWPKPHPAATTRVATSGRTAASASNERALGAETAPLDLQRATVAGSAHRFLVQSL